MSGHMEVECRFCGVKCLAYGADDPKAAAWHFQPGTHCGDVWKLVGGRRFLEVDLDRLVAEMARLFSKE